MKILFIGKREGNSYLTYKVIKKINKNTDFLNTSYILNSKIKNFIFWNLFPYFFKNKINNFYKKKIQKKYDLFFFFNTELITNDFFINFKNEQNKIFFYCADNPFVNRDKKRWFFVKKIIKKFDLVIFHQKSREKYVKKYGIKKYISIYPPIFDEILNLKLNRKTKGIVFLGTWMPGRGKFFYELKKNGIEVKIYGPNWNKDSKYYKLLKNNIDLKKYPIKKVKNIINKFKIAIALYSKGNKDELSRRSFEIPAIGTLLLSENSNLLKKFFKNNLHAVYFKNSLDCSIKCKKLLLNSSKIERIRNAAHSKILKTSNIHAKNIFKKILNSLDSKNIKNITNIK